MTVACMTSNIVSPTPRYLSATERNVGSVRSGVSTLKGIHKKEIQRARRNIPETTGPSNAC